MRPTSTKEWSIIARTNCLLSGYRIVKYQKAVGGPMPDILAGRGYDKKSSKSREHLTGRTVTDYKIERTPYNGRQYLHPVIDLI